jgi:hypothetical protein
MIVFKATQDKFLSVLQSVAGIVERRHTLPILANVLVRNTRANSSELVGAYEPNMTAKAAVRLFRPSPSRVQAGSYSYLSAGLKLARCGAMAAGLGCVGFFSSSKANLRNAP